MSLVRPFTPRQREIAAGLLRGLSYRAIAAELGLSSHTIRVHVVQMSHLVLDVPLSLPPRSRVVYFLEADTRVGVLNVFSTETPQESPSD